MSSNNLRIKEHVFIRIASDPSLPSFIQSQICSMCNASEILRYQFQSAKSPRHKDFQIFDTNCFEMIYFASLVFIHFFVLLNRKIIDAQSIEQNGLDGDRFSDVEPGSSVFITRNKSRCNSQYRSFDGTCTNHVYKVAGSAGTAQYSYIPSLSSTIPTGSGLPSARYISNVLCSQASDIYNKRKLNEFLVFFGQFLDHTFVASTTKDGTSFPIPLAPDDSKFANFSSGELPFTRHKRTQPIPLGDDSHIEEGVERPVNLLSSAIDLASVYGAYDERADYLRSHTGGQMHVSSGNLLPFDTFGLSNVPTSSEKFFVAGDDRVNEHPVLTALHTVFVREHNKLAEELASVFTKWDDEKLFQEARKINIAQYQKIVYEEFFPMLTGRKMPSYQGYNKSVIPAISIEFSTAAFRIGHTLVGNTLTMRGEGMSDMPSIPMSDVFFPHSNKIVKSGVDVYLRGAMYARAQEVDTQASNMLRNHLFSNVDGVQGLDLIALNIQRGRDHALPSYNELRRLFTSTVAQNFSDITSNVALQNQLQTAYGNVDKIEVWVGLMAEDHIPGGSVGTTLFAIWVSEFGRLRDGDRFFYANKDLFKSKRLARFPRLSEILNGSDSMKKIILRNTNITNEEIGKSIWLSHF